MVVLFQRLTLASIALLSVSSAAAGEMRRLEIEIEPIIILNCVEQVNYTLNTTALLAAGRSGLPSISAPASSAATPRIIEARLSADAIADGRDETLVEINVDEACSLRGLGRGEGFLVDVRAASNATLINENGNGALAVRDARGRTSYGGAYAGRFSIPQSRIRLDRPIQLDVQLRVDMNFAVASGRYSSPVDGVFSIEVSAP